jgi:hypothetical protein
MKLFVCLFLMLCPAGLYAVENYDYFIESQSCNGPTGNIETPSTRVLQHGDWSLGIHRFIVGVDYGLFRNFELGINFDLKDMSPLFPMDRENLDRKSREISLHSKYRILREEEHPLDVSIGQRRDTFYLTAGKLFENLRNTTLQAGLLWERHRLSTFFAVDTVSPNRQLLFDYNPVNDHCNIGCRFLVAPEIKLDFFLTDIARIKNILFDNFMFGLTVVM